MKKVVKTNRRSLLKWCSLSVVAPLSKTTAKNSGAYQLNPLPDTVTEDQRGDPGDSDEYVTFSPSAIQNIVSKSGKAIFEAWDENLPASMIATTRQFVGRSRKTNPQEISQFLDLFNLPPKTEKGDVPFCAAGLSYCGLLTYFNHLNGHSGLSMTPERLRALMPDLEHYYFYPTVSCVDMYHIAAGKRKWRPHDMNSTTLPKPGWLVLYDWNRRGTPDHCGLVQQATKNILVTIEFNTSVGDGSQRNGGMIAEKTRTYDYVTGFVITDASP
jgi:hypothetical protein